MSFCSACRQIGEVISEFAACLHVFSSTSSYSTDSLQIITQSNSNGITWFMNTAGFEVSVFNSGGEVFSAFLWRGEDWFTVCWIIKCENIQKQ